MTKISKKFLKMSEVYKVFVSDRPLDFSDQSREEMYLYESMGKPVDTSRNGYYWGKKYLNLCVTDWKKDMDEDMLFVDELYADTKFPHWWLDSIFKDYMPKSRINRAMLFWRKQALIG